VAHRDDVYIFYRQHGLKRTARQCEHQRPGQTEAVVLGLTLCSLEASAATISSDFSADLDGWTISSGSGALSYSATGGNPGGYLFVDNAEGATIVRAIAPAKLLGNLGLLLRSH
jgi:hypothetical protein